MDAYNLSRISITKEKLIVDHIASVVGVNQKKLINISVMDFIRISQKKSKSLISSNLAKQPFLIHDKTYELSLTSVAIIHPLPLFYQVFL